MLPKAFTERMMAMLGEEWNEFLACYDKNTAHALRLNTLKSHSADILEKYPFTPVPWAENGYYYNEDITPGKHPYHEAGVYYIQEPSAMAPADCLNVMPGDIVLDLCAAPGGKSTQIACKMQGSGLMISNEIHPARAKILSENIERMGIRNAIVTNSSSEMLAQHFPKFFDKIMVDAPCSGEGMFRKNPEACKEWSPEAVERCAARQQEILHNASLMLKPGGQMVYSTCTFSVAENEAAITSFLDSHPDFYLKQIPSVNGFSSGGLEGTIRLWPHRVQGEGHFLALLGRQTEPDTNSCHNRHRDKTIRGISQKDCKNCIEFLAENLRDSDAFLKKRTIIQFGDNLYLVPDMTPDLSGIKVLRPGLHIGTMRKNRFEPSHSLALSLTPDDVKHVCCLSSPSTAIYDYLNGQTFSYEGMKGWYLICVDHYSIGWGKLAGDIMKNHYPKGLRKHLCLTNTFS